MSKQISVKKNIVMNVILTMSSILFPLITFPYISRVLLAEGTGKIQFVTSVVTYFTMFAQLGIPTYGIKACAKVRDNKEELSRVVHELLIINFAMVLATYAVFAITLVAVPRFRTEWQLFLILGSGIFLNAIGVEWLYKGLEQYTYITVRSLIFKVISVIAMFALVHKPEHYIIYGAISLVAASASNILNFINLYRFVELRPVGGYGFIRHIKMILIFFAMSVATVIYTNLDNVMLGFIKDDTEVGIYGAAVKIKTVLVNLVTSAGVVLLPRASYYVEHEQMEEFYRILQKAMRFVVMLALPCMVFFMIFAKDTILILSGEEFLPAVPAMVVIMPTLLLIGMSNVIGIQMLIPIGRERDVLFSEIAGAVTDLILNILLIQKLGSTGAAIGTFTAELVVLAWQIIVVWHERKRLFDGISLLKDVSPVLICGALSVWMLMLPLPSVVRMALAAVLFFGVYLVFQVLFQNSLLFEIIGTVKEKLFRK